MGQIDTSIYRNLVMPQIKDPLTAMREAQELRIREEEARGLRDQREAYTAELKARTEAMRREQQKYEALKPLFANGQTPTPSAPGTAAALYRAVGPEDGAAILRLLLDMQNRQIDTHDKLVKSMKTRLAGIRAFPEAMRGQMWDAAVNDYKARGLDTSEIAPYSAETLEAYERELLSPDKQYEIAHPAPQQVGGALVQRQPDGSYKPVYQPEKPHSYQAKDVLLGGRPTSVNFDTTTGRYFQGDVDVTDRVQPIPPERARATDPTRDDPSLPFGVQDYLTRLRAKYPGFGQAMAEFSRALPDLRRAHPRLNTAKAQRVLQQAYSKQYAPGLDSLITEAMAGEEDEVPTNAGAGPSMPARPAAAGGEVNEPGSPTGRATPAASAAPAGGSLEAQAARILQANGYDSSPAAVQRFLSNPQNRQRLQGGGSR